MAAILLEERADGVLRLILNRPEARNALSVELMTALVAALGRAADDPHSRVLWHCAFAVARGVRRNRLLDIHQA